MSFVFNGNKTITTEQEEPDQHQKLKKIYKLSKFPKFHKWRLEYDDVGYNYRMASLNAALGISQLKTTCIIKKQKEIIFKILKGF